MYGSLKDQQRCLLILALLPCVVPIPCKVRHKTARKAQPYFSSDFTSASDLFVPAATGRRCGGFADAPRKYDHSHAPEDTLADICVVFLFGGDTWHLHRSVTQGAQIELIQQSFSIPAPLGDGSFALARCASPCRQPKSPTQGEP